MKQVIVGTYYIGYEQCQLVLREGTGGEFWFCPENGSLPRMKIGADYKNWHEVVSCLLHETFEFAMTRLQCRYDPSNKIPPLDYSQYLFVMQHTFFSDCCSIASYFLVDALPDLSKAWKKWQKKGGDNMPCDEMKGKKKKKGKK